MPAGARTDNAHVRKPRGDDTGRFADEAQRLLDDPAFERALTGMREALVSQLETLQHDGQPETKEWEAELCRTLRNLYGLKRNLALSIQGQKLRLADFRPREPEKD